ncbi:MAG: hypothetical protein FJ027_22160 [Candidatus Rokubacteria bacterium]|nr:hypothetical protein [Candidatus Rokubacteria bacterium]
MSNSQRIGEDHMPGVFRALLHGLGFDEPSWIALFIVVVSAALLAVGAVAIRNAVGGWRDRGDTGEL